MYRCNECGANVDVNEIHNGICDDCIEESMQKEERQAIVSEQIEIGIDGQIVMKRIN